MASSSTALATPAAQVAERDARAATARAERKDSGPMKVFYVVASILIPPLAVAIKTGDPCETLINCGWWVCGLVPAMVHAVMVSFGDTRCSCVPETAMAVPPGQRIEEAIATQAARWLNE